MTELCARYKLTPPLPDNSRELLGLIGKKRGFIVTGGEIELSIEKSSGFYEGMVMIRYRDSQNVEAKIQKDLEDI